MFKYKFVADMYVTVEKEIEAATREDAIAIFKEYADELDIYGEDWGITVGHDIKYTLDCSKDVDNCDITIYSLEVLTDKNEILHSIEDRIKIN